MKLEDFRTETENQWCPACPNFGILAAVRSALVNLNKRPESICLVSGIGQAAKMPHYVKANFFNGLHGRALPVAQAVKTVNPDLTTIVTTGDGDCYGEGGNHFIHAIRRNPDITLIVHDNQIYGLTKGQASPTTEIGDRTRLQFDGVENEPLNPLAVALINGCGFIARGFAGDIPHLTDMIIQAIQYRGFALVDVIQPCISWGTHPVEWYKERVHKLPSDYNPTDKQAALIRMNEWKERIPIGILYYAKEPRECFGDRFRREARVDKLTALGFPEAEKVSNFLERFRI